ncbi:putative oxidoreductase CatD [Collibacillus ludicampi]|uniref:Oxidoreductase CatD n=1 Tax=Collibacillus ludicampi TaxID=2771369 RepID=A0AAV4LF03_9BACL|nr:DoxX family protein [Collibacillus ludicampi]GIM46343.1 putative oxidoreductase CatD [Collibacillus ludicampi]
MTNRYEIGSLILRLMLGITFFVHGFAKFHNGIGHVVGFFNSLGIPGFAAYVIATLEVLGGIALVLGIGTRIVSTLFAFDMLGAIFTARLKAGFMGGYEFELALLVISISLALTGSRFYAFDQLRARSKQAA